MIMLGVDIGGSGIKAAPVDVETGAFAVDRRHRVKTPKPATPDAVVAATVEVIDHFGVKGPFGCAFPAIVRNGIVRSAANIDESWIGVDGRALLEEATGYEVVLLNDADAAGIAEMTVGAGAGTDGVVIVLTFGTGIGSGMFVDGLLVPNTELGHLEWHGGSAEDHAAARLVEHEDLPMEDWSSRVKEYLQHLERLFSPELFVIGGGISKEFDDFGDALDIETRVVPAALRNRAGIVGAAMAAYREYGG